MECTCAWCDAGAGTRLVEFPSVRVGNGDTGPFEINASRLLDGPRLRRGVRCRRHFGRLVAMLPVGTRGQMAHHTNYEMPRDGRLFASDYMSGEGYVLDL